MEFEFAAGSLTGPKHPENEDRWIAKPESGLFAVADGMSGDLGGDVASQITVQMVEEYVRLGLNEGRMPEELLREAVLAANFAVFRHSLSHPKWIGMGTTATAALVKESLLTIAHVGDSRCYRVLPDSIVRLTRDHTRSRGGMESDRLVLTRSVGVQESLEVELISESLNSSSFVLLCSDGLCGHVEDEEILRIFIKNEVWTNCSSAILQNVLGQLARSARLRGSDDDITIVIVRGQ